MTVQELINALNKVEDRNKKVVFNDLNGSEISVDSMEEYPEDVTLFEEDNR